MRRREHSTWVGIDRPSKRNALSLEIARKLDAAIDETMKGTPSVLVIHSTTPGNFVAGADISELAARRTEDAMQAVNVRLFQKIEAYRWPTIAAVDGPALGGGCELALACDLRIASGNARFAQPEPSLGIIAGAGGNWRLSQLTGIGVARRMLYLGETLDASAALAVGLVDRLVPPEDLESEVLNAAREIASRSWRALELTKLALRQNDRATTNFDLVAQALLFEASETGERMGAFLNRSSRDPKPSPATNGATDGTGHPLTEGHKQAGPGPNQERRSKR